MPQPQVKRSLPRAAVPVLAESWGCIDPRWRLGRFTPGYYLPPLRGSDPTTITEIYFERTLPRSHSRSKIIRTALFNIRVDRAVEVRRAAAYDYSDFKPLDIRITKQRLADLHFDF